MGRSNDEFVKYPRTPHLFGSRGTSDDKHLSEEQSRQFIQDQSLIIEEKLDGTNVGLHFTSDGQMVLQCRGHLITEGMHPQYDLYQTMVRGEAARVGTRFGRWVDPVRRMAVRPTLGPLPSTAALLL